MIDLITLLECGLHPTQAKSFQSPLDAAMMLYDISTPLRQAAFIAQCMHESTNFTALEENLWYTDAARAAGLFRSAFDVDHNGTVSRREVEGARTFLRQPEKLANRIYGGRMGNGPEASGDGWKFRGRGLIQLTGRSNYALASTGVGRPYLTMPTLVAMPEDACLTAAWYWATNGCNKPADSRNIDVVTSKINPSMAGKDERRKLYAKALRAFHIN